MIFIVLSTWEKSLNLDSDNRPEFKFYELDTKLEVVIKNSANKILYRKKAVFNSLWKRLQKEQSNSCCKIVLKEDEWLIQSLDHVLQGWRTTPIKTILEENMSFFHEESWDVIHLYFPTGMQDVKTIELKFTKLPENLKYLYVSPNITWQ